jgi:hypothetical protein
MKNSKFLYFLLFIALKAFSQDIPEVNYETFQEFLDYQNNNLSKINIGQNPDDVLEIMGASQIVTIPKVGKMKALNQLFKQPHSVNEYKSNPEKNIKIFWYFSTPKDQNGLISKSECTPIIFENDEVVGFGWDFFNSYRRKTPLR